MTDSPARSWLRVLGRAVRWQPRSYVQIWVIVAAGCLGCAIVFPLVAGPARDGAVGFAQIAVPWIGTGCGWSYRLRGRRRAAGGTPGAALRQ